MFIPLPRFKDKIKDCIIGTKLNITIIIDAGITNVHPITFLFFVFTVFPPIRIDFTAFFLKNSACTATAMQTVCKVLLLTYSLIAKDTVSSASFNAF